MIMNIANDDGISSINYGEGIAPDPRVGLERWVRTASLR
jgi:hypothetical protein